MFQLFEMTKEVRIEPKDLNNDRVESVKDFLEGKLANRVVLGVGLCITLWDIREIKQGVIYPGDGGVHCTVKFRCVVFRPVQDEILVGRIKRCTPDGVHVTMGFFDDIFIPQEGLQHPSRFDEREQIWIWDYKAEDEEDEVHEMYMDKGEGIRFRVTGEQFSDTTPVPQALGGENHSQGGGPSTSTGGGGGAEGLDQAPKIPYSLTGSINEPGLGLLSWWC